MIFILSNLIFLLFPFVCYLIYLFFCKSTYEREKNIFLDLAIYSSFYLFVRFGNLNLLTIFLINLPLFVAILKKRLVPYLLLSFFAFFVFKDFYLINNILFFMETFVILILYYKTKLKLENIFACTKTMLFLIYVLFFNQSLLFSDNLFYILGSFIVMYIIFIFVRNFDLKMKKILEMFYSLEEITREKKLYESLFKITHEIKNPLAVCKGYLDMFDIRNPSKASKYVGIIDQEIDRTLLLLKDFSDISKINIEKNKIELNSLLDDVCDEAKMILKNNINFIYNIDSKETYILADYNRIKQVLINIIKNAKEAVGEKGVIELNTNILKNKVEIIIKDDGIGMDKETMEKIGTPFFTTKSNGTGLGVCLSKEIVEKHNGSLCYESNEGKGTQVHLILPLEEN